MKPRHMITLGLTVLSISFFSIPTLVFAQAVPEPNPDLTPVPDIEVPTPSPSATPTPEALKRDLRVPLFYDVKPQWGLQLNFSPNALGGSQLTNEQGKNPAFAFTLNAEFQPRFLQFFGVIGFGLSATVYPIPGGNNLTTNFASVWSAGGQIRYQAKYFRQQILIPNIAYTYEYFSYAFSAGQSGSLRAQGPVYGLWLLLNQLDRSAAADFYIDAGVARTYLIFEGRNLVGAEGVSFNGLSYYVGLRMEM